MQQAREQDFCFQVWFLNAPYEDGSRLTRKLVESGSALSEEARVV